MFTTENQIKKFLITKKSEEDCYNAGYDCGINGVRATNSCFSFFTTKEKAAAWERGNEQAQVDKKNKELPS